MAAKKPAIPAAVAGASAAQQRFNTAVKENIELITGKRPNSVIASLSTGATLAEVIAKVNDMLTAQQG